MNDEAILTAEQLAMWQEYVGGGDILNEYTLRAVASRLSWLEDALADLRLELVAMKASRNAYKEAARRARTERDALRGEVVALRRVVSLAEWDNSGLPTLADWRQMVLDARAALAATPHAAAFGALVEATVEEERLRNRYDDERMSLAAGRKLMAEIVAASLRRAAAADAVLALRDRK